jgi:hypothetical protein
MKKVRELVAGLKEFIVQLYNYPFFAEKVPVKVQVRNNKRKR